MWPSPSTKTICWRECAAVWTAAVSRHRRRRKARTLTSSLDSLAGIGPGRRKALLRRFGSLQGVREASLEDLQDALGPKVGDTVFHQLHPVGDGDGAS